MILDLFLLGGVSIAALAGAGMGVNFLASFVTVGRVGLGRWFHNFVKLALFGLALFGVVLWIRS